LTRGVKRNGFHTESNIVFCGVQVFCAVPKSGVPEFLEKYALYGKVPANDHPKRERDRFVLHEIEALERDYKVPPAPYAAHPKPHTPQASHTPSLTHPSLAPAPYTLCSSTRTLHPML